MRTILTMLWAVSDVIRCLGELLGYGLKFLLTLCQPKAVLAVRLLAVESQLAVYMRRIQQKQEPRPRFTTSFRFLWVVLSKLWGGWEACAHLMQPATVKRWHTTAFRLFWRWKSRPRGRAPVSRQMQGLIRKLSRENALWGAGQIRDTLLLLGYDPPCEDTVRKYMVRPRKPRMRSTTWLPFLRNHVDVSWAIDFFTVTTVRFAILYVFVVLDHGRRRVIHFATTYAPSMEWVIQQLREVTPFGRQPRYLFRDNDGIYGHGVPAFLKRCGIREVRTAYRSPWQNGYASWCTPLVGSGLTWAA